MIDHPNCLRLYEMFDDDEYLYLIVDLVPHGDLLDQIEIHGTLTEKEASKILA